MTTHDDDRRSTELRRLALLAACLPDGSLHELLHLARRPEELQELSDIAGRLSPDELRDLREWVRVTSGTRGGIQ